MSADNLADVLYDLLDDLPVEERKRRLNSFSLAVRGQINAPMGDADNQKEPQGSGFPQRIM